MNIIYDMLDHGREHNNPKLIVIHALGEQITDGKFTRHARDFLDSYGLSAHCLGTPDGDIIQCRSEDQIAWHALGHNTNSLGYEVLVPGVHDYMSFLKAIRKKNWPTEAQMVTAAAQVREWMYLYHIKIDKVVRHSDLSPDRKVDPGTGFNWIRFKKLLEK